VGPNVFRIREDNKEQSRRVRSTAVLCQNLIESAHAEAKALTDCATEEAVALKKRAQAQGYLRGQQEAISTLIAGDLIIKKALCQSRTCVLECALAVAKEVVGEALDVQPQSVVARVERALSFALGSPTISLVASSEDVPYLRQFIKQKCCSALKGTQFSIREDDSLLRGYVRLETPLGMVEASTAQHLEGIGQYLRACMDLDSKNPWSTPAVNRKEETK
jgi:flagellar biosynthesis/type III secretory pathway protein FliH